MNLFRSTQFWIGVGFLFLILILRYGLGGYVTLDMVQAKRMQLELFVATHYLWSVLFFMMSYIVMIMLGLPLVALGMVVAGFLFGIIPALIYTNVGATCGAILFFFIIRYSLGKSLQGCYRDKLVWFNEQIRMHGAYYLLGMRFFTFIPFFVENILAGLSTVSAWTFIWTTSIGIIPGSLVYVFAGKQLATISSIQELFTWKLFVIFGVLALFALMPVLVKGVRRGSC